MKPVAEAEEDRESLIDGSYLFPRKFAEDAPDPPFVDGSQLVDQREGLLGETALARPGSRPPLRVESITGGSPTLFLDRARI